MRKKEEDDHTNTKRVLMDNIILYSTKKEAIREMIHSFFISMGKFT